MKWKWKRKDLPSLLLAGAMLAAALGIIAWQGLLYMDEKTASKTVMRIVPGTTTTVSLPSDTTATGTATFSGDTSTATMPAQDANVESGASVGQETPQATSTAAPQVTFPLELNGATAEELDQLPEIGPVLAQRIVTYRTQIGGYLYREQLLEVEGIGEATLAQIYDLVYLEQEYIPQQPTETQPPVQTDPPAQTSPTQATTTAQPATAPPQTTAATTTLSPATTEPVEVDLNTATQEELMQVPHMTEPLAQDILAFRETYGYFTSVYEVLYLEHVSQQQFPEMMPYLSVDPPETTGEP